MAAPNITLVSATNLIRAIQAWNGGEIDPDGPNTRFRISLQIIKARDDGGVTASGKSADVVVLPAAASMLKPLPGVPRTLPC